jgi:protein-S-isoprenylcysteine O-methyltransferase Ste14
MQFLPPMRLGILNGWLMLMAYFVGLTISALSFPADKRKKLFLEPHYPRGHPRWIILALGRIAAISFVALMLFASLRLEACVFYIGLAVYAAGYAAVIVSLNDYRRAPTDELVTSGLYRRSRNPQWLGLVGVFVGTALAVGGWLHLLLVSLLAVAYHFQILLEEGICEAAYGAEYLEYMSQVPRYFLV